MRPGIMAGLLICGMTAAGAWAAQPDLKEVARKLDDLYRADSSVARMELISQSGVQKRHLQMKTWSRGKDKALIVIEAPPREAGSATLKIGNNLWNYLPNIARTIRIPPSMMLASWMGTDITNDDLVRDSSYADDFVMTLEGHSEDPRGWVIQCEAKPGLVGRWQKLKLWIDEAGELPLKIEYYDRKGRLARSLRFEDVKVFGGRKVPTHMIFKTEDEEGRVTEVRYLDLKYNVEVPESTFSLSRLEKK